MFCEHHGEKELKCDANEVLQIRDANYGRLSVDYCQFGLYRKTNCRSPASLGMIKNTCNGMNLCTLNPSNEIYGNPCGIVVKYISVEYDCVKYVDLLILLSSAAAQKPI